MRVIETIDVMKTVRHGLRGTVGFVPTMGYLHEGHLALVKRAKAENPLVVVSIFVNPTQFLPNEDFNKYPRDTARDLGMLEQIGVDIVFLPAAGEMYQAGFSTRVNVDKITEKLEGAARPGHFTGVATVCNKLFNVIEPHTAYFGQKDAQQCAVIKKMIADLNMNLAIVVVPTVREPDGLAMSSRNVYLDSEERRQAPVIYQSLELAQRLWREGERDAFTIIREMSDLVSKQPLARIEYISIADAGTLEELKEVKTPALISMAVKFGKTRLLDNILLD